MTKREAFRVIRTYEEFEIREYEPCLIAEVRVSEDNSIAKNDTYGSLSRYIKKGNQTSRRIAITAPVFAAQRAEIPESDQWFISYILSSGETVGYLPDPKDPEVVIRELDGESCAVISFKGRATEELIEKKIQELRNAAKDKKIALSRETRIFRLDSPVKPSFMQFNEIVIPAYLWAE